MTKTNFKGFLVKDLRQHLKKHGHSTKGRKNELIERIRTNNVPMDGLVSTRKKMGEDRKKVLRERLHQGRKQMRMKRMNKKNKKDEEEKVLEEESVATDVKDSFKAEPEQVKLTPSPDLDNTLKDVNAIKNLGRNDIISLYEQVVESLNEDTAEKILKSKIDVMKIREMIVGNKGKSVRVLKGMLKEMISPNNVEDIKEEVITPDISRTIGNPEFTIKKQKTK